MNKASGDYLAYMRKKWKEPETGGVINPAKGEVEEAAQDQEAYRQFQADNRDRG